MNIIVKHLFIYVAINVTCHPLVVNECHIQILTYALIITIDFVDLFFSVLLPWDVGQARQRNPSIRPSTTPDKTVETFQYNCQFRAMVLSCPKETNSSPSPHLVQCCFGLAAQGCISCVTANNIAIGEGGDSL